MRKIYLFYLAVSVSLLTLIPEANAGPGDTVVVAGKKYDRGFLHCLFWGKHYRKVWAEPVKVPYLNLKTEFGGLKPVERGGSYQTKNLRLEDPKGREFVIRSVDKDPSQTLSEGKRNSFFGRLLRDQTSVVHPYGALIIPPLAEAAGVMHANPRIFVVPNDPALGEFRGEFANILAYLEERPNGDQSKVADFGFSKEVESSKKMFSSLVENNKNSVDTRAFLRARLFDMWLGDWSRREDQWRWATYEQPNGGTKFVGIPRDRDHAFFKFNDGFFTWLISLYATNLQTFGPKIRNLDGLNETGAPLDKTLLTFLKKEDFRQIGDSLRMRLTDQVIEKAVRTWPENIYKISGAEMEKNLKKRRDQLPSVAEEYYHILAEKIDLPGSDKKEKFKLTGQNNSLLVEVFKPGKKGAPDSLLASRTLLPSETNTLKIYGLGEDDEFEISGEGNPIKHVIIYDGEGQDKLEFKAKKKKIIKVMDSGDGNEFPKTRQIKVVPYAPKANEYNGEGWLLRHRLY